MSENELKKEISSDLWFQKAEQEEELKSRIVKLSIDDLHPFKNHPFKIRDDEEMSTLASSAERFGCIKVPI